uniref:3-phosphoinositide-dependent protein kinase 1 n=1 Tax=Dracunculus medinensis TaxID=318479 RepID=A0A0N4U6Q9_DRAME
LEFMHECSIIHRDLKPENILITAKRHIMLSDFGTAKIIGAEVGMTSTIDHKSDRNNSFVGTAEYFSPEALKDWEIGPACDYWALGAIIFQMISGTPPFRGINHYHIFQRIQKLDYSFPSGFPELSKDLVYDPKKRLGSNEMAHNFFSMIEWENLPSMTPPPLKAYVPASAGEPAYHSDFINPEDIEPGFDSATKSRLMGASVKEFLSQLVSFFNLKSHVLLSRAAIEAKQAERQRRLEEQNQNNPYHHIVGERLILKSGLLIKKKGLSYRRRIFLLTEGPHIHYVDEATKEHKGEIPMCKKLRTEGKNFRAFFVHTPYRTYYLFDPAERAMEWCDAIDDLRNRYMDILPETSDPPKSKRYRVLFLDKKRY